MKAKKSLGQNWLKSASAIKEIIKAGELKPGELVLEIGPGRGALTKALLSQGVKVLAVEKDDFLIKDLQEKFGSEIKAGKLILIHQDISDFNVEKGLKTLDKGKYKLIANIPYYITGQIIRQFLSQTTNQPNLMVLMVQKEVAKRIVASDKKESILSISTKAYGEPKYIKTVPAGAFDPRPKVDSAILQIKDITRNKLKNTKEEEFFNLVKKGFGQKRKMLKGNLTLSDQILNACNIEIKARAEDLTLENWLCLTSKIKN